MPKLLIAGLDGATWDVLQPLLDVGQLPTLANLINKGGQYTLQSTWPPISSAAWVTMMSGMNPGRHGVYDFRNLNLSHYSAHDERLANANSYTVLTLFDYLSHHGLTCIAYQVPMTYPPRPGQGYLISGYPTPDHRKAYTYPPELADLLGELFTHSPDQIGASSPAGQSQIYQRYMKTMTDNLIRLSDEIEWDVLMFVNGATDGAQHRFFKFVQPGFPGVSDEDRTRYGHLLDEIMVAADAELGRLLAHLPDDVQVIVMSDHGGIPRPTKAFNLNAWLVEQGWLAKKAGVASSGRKQGQQFIEWAKQRLPIGDWVKKRLPGRVKERITHLRSGTGSIDWLRTQAYRVKLSHPVEGVHLNVVGRQPEGIISQADYSALRDEIMARLAERPEIVEVHPREAIFAGEHVHNAPDILLKLRPDFDGGADLDGVVTEIPAGWLKAISGYHDFNGILVPAGTAFQPANLPQTPTLADLTPTILHLLDLPIPHNMDGHVLSPLFTQRRVVRYGEPLAQQVDTADRLSAEEEAGIAEALRDLGYIE